MRNFWMIISGAALVVGVSGAVYYFFPKHPVNPDELSTPALQSPQTDSRVLVVPASNPLLTADESQFGEWLPPYCGADIFLQSQPQQHKVDVCVNGTVSRVAAATGVKLARADVLDPRVKARWREVMGAK